MNIVETIELYILIVWIVSYVNYTSNKLWGKNGKRKELSRAIMADLTKGKIVISDHWLVCLFERVFPVYVYMCAHGLTWVFECFRVFWFWTGPGQYYHIGKFFPILPLPKGEIFKLTLPWSSLYIPVGHYSCVQIRPLILSGWMDFEEKSLQAEVSSSGMENDGLLGQKLA